MSRQLKNLLRYVAKAMSWHALRCRLMMSYRLWGIEGVNRVLLLCDSSYVGEILTRFGAVIDPDHDLNAPLLIHNAATGYSNLTVGEHCHLGKEVFLDLRDAITIEDNATISMRVTILTHIDVGHSPLRENEFPPRHSPVRIEQGAYIGAGATILQGVTIGECAVVGAGAVVASDIPAYCMAAGVPAKVVRRFG